MQLEILSLRKRPSHFLGKAFAYSTPLNWGAWQPEASVRALFNHKLFPTLVKVKVKVTIWDLSIAGCLCPDTKEQQVPSGSMFVILFFVIIIFFCLPLVAINTRGNFKLVKKQTNITKMFFFSKTLIKIFIF